MTPEQYDRWKDFALRMARICFKGRRRPDTKWIVEVVTDFFAGFDADDIPCIFDWDSSEPYAEGSRLYRKTYRCPCWNCSKRDAKVPCPYDCEGGKIFDLAHPYGVGDMTTEFLDEYRVGAPRCKSCNHHCTRWSNPPCRFCDLECRCDEVEDHFYDQWDEQWGGPVRCCIRAGLDCASAPSGGVVGFTAGDIRAMYPDGVPAWVFPPDEHLHYWLSDEVNGTFAELPDAAGVVL